jgi:Tfp pilus assembly protein PilF
MILVIVLLLVLLTALLLVDWKKLSKSQTFEGMSRFAQRRALTLQVHEEKLVKQSKGKTEKKHEFHFEPTEERQAQPEVSEYRPTSEVESLLAEADICFRKGEVKAAEDQYLKAAAKDPKCSKAYSRLGVIYLEHGDNWQDAEAAFRQALKYDSENGFVLNNLGLVLYHQDRFADSIRNFEQAVRLDEHNAARHANLGMAYMAMRQYAKSESSFKKALKLSPNDMEYKDLLTESIEKKNAHKTMVRR